MMALQASSSSGKIPLKPYMCALCREAFSKARSLQKHMTWTHGLEEEQESEDNEDEEFRVLRAIKGSSDERNHLLESSEHCRRVAGGTDNTDRLVNTANKTNDVDSMCLADVDATERQSVGASSLHETEQTAPITDLLGKKKHLEPVSSKPSNNHKTSNEDCTSNNLQHHQEERPPALHVKGRSVNNLKSSGKEGQVLRRSRRCRKKKGENEDQGKDKKLRTQRLRLSLPEAIKEKEKRRTLAQKIQDLQKANEETEKYKYTIMVCDEGAETKSPDEKSPAEKPRVQRVKETSPAYEHEQSSSVKSSKGHNIRGDTYKCKFCNAVYKSKGNLRIHAAKNCGKGDHKCLKCMAFAAKPSTKDFEEMSHAVQEARDMTDSNDYKRVRGKQLVVQYYQCIVCNDRFAVEKHLREHLKTHHLISCQFCDTVFPSTRELCRHIPVHNRGPLSCCTCQQTFFSTYMLLLHMRGHTGNFQCPVCNASFMFRANLPRHMKQKHSTDHQTSTSTNVEIAEEKCSPQRPPKELTQELKLRCLICGNLYATETTLRRHLEHFHCDNTQNKQQFMCEVCGAVRKSMKQLKNHMVCHQKPTKRCALCGKVFVRKSSLKLHIQQMHEEKREFQCRYCCKGLTSRASLANHERLHTGEKPYECDDCGKRFRLGTSYRTHRAVEHTGEQPVACDKCSKRFMSRALLTKHLRTHLPRSVCPCSVCGKTFKREDLLKKHMVLHRRQIRCPECSRLFANDFAFCYHMKKIHKKDLYRIDHQSIVPVYSVLSPQQSHDLSQISEQDFRALSLPGDKDALSVNIVDSPSHLVADEDSIGARATTPAALHSAGLSFDQVGKLSDPTNLAITAILSELCTRV